MAIECPKCQHQNDEDAEECASCGEALEIPMLTSEGSQLYSVGGAVSPALCSEHPEANVKVEGDQLVCSQCGKTLGKLDANAEETYDVPSQEDADQIHPGIGKAGFLEVEGGQEVFFRGAYTTKIPLKNKSILVGRRDVMASHYPDVDLMMYRKLDPAISRRHLRFFRESGIYYIEDLCNNNATFLNDYNNKLNHERRALHHGDRIFVSMSLALLFKQSD